MKCVRQSRGFTLVELVVVLSLLSMLLFFAVPRMQQSAAVNSFRESLNWIAGSVRQLKARAVAENRLYRLHVDIDVGRLWVTHESMSEEEETTAVRHAFILPDTMNIVDVETPRGEKAIIGAAVVRFYKKGYADRAIIHIEDRSHRQQSIVIEPFLAEVDIAEGYKSFDE